MHDEMLRTFIAIELDAPLRVALARVQEKLKRLAPPGSIKWVAPDGIHLTLKFLGDTPRSRLVDIESGLRAACASRVPFEFVVEGRGCFPNCRRPRVIWVAVRDRGQMLARLQASVEEHVAPLGWPTETREFSPHLTLGRIAKGANADVQAAAGQAVERTVVEEIGRQRVTAVSLIRSELLRTGAIYTPLARCMLAGGRSQETAQG